MRSRFFFALLVLAFPSALRAAPALIPPEEILRVSSIRPGMRGYGLTVFRGTRIERFDVQVIDILRRDYLGRDMLLVRMRGGPITERGANIIAGMSGSPIYLGGKLAGAVSMGWGFPKEPVAIVTPIEAMADAFDPRLPQKPLLTSLPAAFEEPRAAGAEWPSAEHALFPAGQGMVGPAYGTYTPYRSEEAAPLGSGPLPTRRPLMTPLFTHGLSPANVRRLGALVAPFGLEVAAGAGGRALDTGDIPFRAGAGIGVYLATGDIEIGGTGTLTYRKGNRILAFGHPMFQFGAVDLPMTTVHIHDVASTYSRSFKLASMARVVGAITQDGPFSIAGRVHRMPRMIPLEIAVNDTGSGRRQTFRVQAASHPILSGRIIEMAASEGIARVRAFPGEAMARVRLRVEAENLPPIVRENAAFDYFDPNGFGYSALRELEELVGILNGSPFGQVPIRRVAVSITLSPGRRTATIERAWVDRDRVEPGETVRVSAVLRPWKGTPEVKALDVKVPAGTPDGRAFLYVAGGASSLPARPSMGGFFFIRDVGRPGAAEPATNVRQLVRRYLERERNDHLVARLFLPGPSGSVGGERLLRLPPPLAEVMRSAKATGFFPMLEEVKERVSLDRVVGGTQMIPITIERRSLAEKRGAGRPAASSSGSPPLPMPSPSGMPHASIGNDYAAAPPPREGAAVLDPPRPPGVAPLPQSDRPHPSDRSNADNDDEEDTPALSSREGTGARRRPGRQVVFWRQRSYQDWERGDTKGTVATSDGTIRLVPTVMSVRPFAEENCIWAMASDAAGNFAVGTGSDGRLYRRTFDGKVRLLLDAPEAQILAVACDARGSVYAGTAPGGVIYRVRPDGAAVTYFRTGERFVLSLALDAAGNLYAGTGPSGRIFRVAPDGKGSVYFTTSEPHVMRLAMDGKGALLAGTAGGGVVYRITGAGQGTALLDTGDSAVGGLALDRQGRVVAGTAPRGLVVREGRAKPLYEARAPILALAAGSDGSLYAGAGANLVRLEGEDSAAKLECREQGQILSLVLDPKGLLWAGTGNAAGLFAVRGPEAEGTFDSLVRDAETTARWGRISWEADVPVGTSVALRTRSGNSADPDASWSAWSPEVKAGGSPITSPPARFLQYRVVLRAGRGNARPVLKGVSVSYLPENRPPEVEVKSPLVGGSVSGKPTLTWSGSDPDGDTVTYELFASADRGATWKPLQPAGPEKDTPGAKDDAAPAKKAEPSGKKAPAGEKPGAAANLAPAAGTPAGAAPAKPDKKAAPATDAPRPDAPGGASEQSAQSDRAEPSDVSDQSDGRKPKPAEPPDSKKPEPPKPTEPPEGKKPQPTEATAAGKKPEPLKPGPVTGASFRWDTTGLPDGAYLIRIVASDSRSNPGDARATERIVGPILLANAKPRVVLTQGAPLRGPDGRVALRGRVADTRATIASISYRVDGGDWFAAVPTDGMLDSLAEEFTLRTEPLPAGAHKIEVEAMNIAESAGTETVEVK